MNGITAPKSSAFAVARSTGTVITVAWGRADGPAPRTPGTRSAERVQQRTDVETHRAEAGPRPRQCNRRATRPRAAHATAIGVARGQMQTSV